MGSYLQLFVIDINELVNISSNVICLEMEAGAKINYRAVFTLCSGRQNQFIYGLIKE